MLNVYFKDNRGLAAVEFALVLPVLSALLLGTVAVFDLYSADRVTSRAANSIAEIASRQDTIDDVLRDDLIETGRSLLGRFVNNNTYAVVLTHITNDGTNDIVLWSEANVNGQVLVDADLGGLDIPDIPENGSIVFVQLENRYEPVFKTPVTFSRETSRRPRFVSTITYVD